jgi:hypothetical protein
MKTFFQTVLGLLFASLGFFGTWAGILTWTNWTHPWVACLAVLLIGGACYLSAQDKRSRWLRFPAFGFLVGAGLLGVVLSYARPVPSLCFAVVVLLFSAASIRAISIWKTTKMLISLFVFGWVVFAADHAFMSGQVFAWKWRVIEQPFFGLSGYIKVERHDRRVIYATDAGFLDPWNVAIVWGWHVFPQVVIFGDKMPDGELLKDPKIQEAIR